MTAASSSPLTVLTAAELASKLEAGEVSSVEVTQAHLDRIAAVDGGVHAFLHINEQALETAAAVDARRAAGEKLGPLAGVPIAIKDVLCTLGMPSTAGSRILEGWVPPYDATVVARLRAAGLVLLGKTNMDEFAMGSSTEFSAFGAHPQPVGPRPHPRWLGRWLGRGRRRVRGADRARIRHRRLDPPARRRDRQRRRQADLRRRLPLRRHRARVSSLDQVGPVSRTVLDAALVHDVIGGHDPRDSTSLTDDWPSFADAARAGAAAGEPQGSSYWCCQGA